MLGFSKRGDWGKVHTQLGVLIQKLPSQIKEGGDKVIIATIETMLKMIDDMGKNVNSRQTNVIVSVLCDFVEMVDIMQGYVRNAGTRAVLANVNIELRLMISNIQSSGLDNGRISSSLQSLKASLTAAFNGLKSGSSSGGFSNQRDALQNIFFLFDMLHSQSGSRGQTNKSIVNLLQQLSFLLDGLEFVSSSKSEKNILHSISVNIDITIRSASSRVISSDVLLNLIKMTANTMNLVFDLRGISGAGKFVGGSSQSSSQYLQQISVVMNNLKNSISSNNIGSINSLILQLGN